MYRNTIRPGLRALPIPNGDGGNNNVDPEGGGGGAGAPNGGGKEFAPITSQEDLDRIIGQRLARQKDQFSEQFSDYDEIKSKAAQFDQLQSANQTDLERISNEAADWKAKFEAAEAARGQAEVTALRQSVAIEKGLPPKLAKRLSGSTREEIEADADDLLEAVPEAPRGPKPNPQQGQPSHRRESTLESGRARYQARSGTK